MKSIVKTFPDNGQKPHLSVILWPLEVPNSAYVAQNQSLMNTHPTTVYTNFVMNWVITFPYNIRQPWANACTDEWTLIIPMSPPDFIGGDSKTGMIQGRILSFACQYLNQVTIDKFDQCNFGDL